MRILTAVLLISLCSAAQADSDYQFRVVDFPGSGRTFIFALNNAGQFVGAEQDFAGAPPHAIFDDGRQLQLLELSGPASASVASWAFSINNRGDIAGAYADASRVLHGYLRHADGTLTQIEFPGATATQAFGVNDREEVIGLYSDAQGNSHAFVRRDGRYRTADLPGGTATSTIPLSINDLEQIVGEYIATPGTNGFGYLQRRDGRFQLTTAPGSPPEQTFFISINNRQQILGAFADASGVQHNFLKTGDDYHPFDLPVRLGAAFVSAQTVNDRDAIVGYYLDASSVAHGFVASRVIRRD
jgi:uncharacterized membrane protein